MKTSVTMIRKIGDIEFFQRTSDGYFEANTLLYLWNKKKSNPKRQMLDFLNSKSTKEFLEVLQDDLAQSEKSEVAIIVKKGKNTLKGKSKDEVWMHPYLFIKFAMWINPKFELKVIKFVYDELIKSRHNAGDGYVMLSASGAKLIGYNYREVATALQWIIFNRTGKELRQTASQEQLKELNDIQTKLSFSIDMGYIKTYPQLLKEIRKLYRLKYNTKQVA